MSLGVIVSSLVVGLALGLLGSGGSILSVPALIYLAGEVDKVAVAESLAIVGSIATVAAIPYARRRLISWRTVGFFGLPGMAGAYLGAALSRFVSGSLQLSLFALVMLGAAYAMARSGNAEGGEDGTSRGHPIWLVVSEGAVVGVLTGLVGVGGGFLIVPALVLFAELPMRKAVGTSLAIVAFKSAVGFVKYVEVLASLSLSIDWGLVGLFIAVGILGSWIGSGFSERLPQHRLKQIFAALLVAMGLFMFGKNVPVLFAG